MYVVHVIKKDPMIKETCTQRTKKSKSEAKVLQKVIPLEFKNNSCTEEIEIKLKSVPILENM